MQSFVCMFLFKEAPSNFLHLNVNSASFLIFYLYILRWRFQTFSWPKKRFLKWRSHWQRLAVTKWPELIWGDMSGGDCCHYIKSHDNVKFNLLQKTSDAIQQLPIGMKTSQHTDHLSETACRKIIFQKWCMETCVRNCQCWFMRA